MGNPSIELSLQIPISCTLIKAKINEGSTEGSHMVICEGFGLAKSMLSRQDKERGATDKSKEFVWLVGTGRYAEKRRNITRLSSRGETEARTVSVLSHPRIPLYHSLEYSLYCLQMRYIENYSYHFSTCCPPNINLPIIFPL